VRGSVAGPMDSPSTRRAADGPHGTVMAPIRDDGVRRRIMLRVKRSMRTHPAVRRARQLLLEASAPA